MATRKDSTPPERLPPNSQEAEESVLGCILLNPTECMMQCVQHFPGPEVFFTMALRTVYELLCVMHDGREPMDLITIQQRLRDKNQLEAVGGLAYLSSLQDQVPSAANIDYYIPIVLDKFQRRVTIQGCTDIAKRCYDEEDPKNGIESLHRDFIKLAQMTNRKGDWSVKGALQAALKDIEADIKSGGALTGLPTGLVDFDRKTRGFQPGQFIVIAARPSMGKSSLALQIAEHLAVDKSIPVGVFSLEMDKQSLMRRTISSRSRINLHRISNDLLVGQELDKLGFVAGQIARAPLFVDDTPGLDDVQLRSRMRQMFHELGIKLFVVDYFQLLRARKRVDNRAQELAHVSEGTKLVGRELKVPVIMCAQLNRDVDHLVSKGERPRISHLKDCGSLEQDADLIALLYATKGDDEDRSTEIPAAIDIGKQRNGPTGPIRVVFRKSIFRFEPAQKISQEDVPQI